jgi:hypothetical protein
MLPFTLTIVDDQPIYKYINFLAYVSLHSLLHLFWFTEQIGVAEVP